MPRLPPAPKLTLAVRKNIRDSWDGKKEALAKTLEEALGVAWTFEADPLALLPYAGDDADTIGDAFYSYFESAVDSLKYFARDHGDEGKKELNSIAHAHVIVLDVDEANKVSYCAGDVHEGKLRILFREGSWRVNTGYALSDENLTRALNDAPPAPDAPGPMSYTSRKAIRNDYEPKFEEIRAKVAALLEKPDIKFNPCFEANFAALKAGAAAKGSEVRDDWQSNIGYLTISYFDGFEGQIRYQKFGEDEMLREGFNEMVEKGEIALRIVDKLTGKYGSYCECVIEDGVLYLQTTANRFGTNTNYAAEKLVEILD